MFQAITNKLKTLAFAIGFITALALPLAAQEFRVEGAGLEAVPTSYSGPCPGLIKFRAKIQASTAGRVKYTYFRSDGGTGPEGFVDFDGPGVKLVETTWTLGGASLTHYEGWVAIRILWPNSYESNHAKFVLDCQPGKDKQPNAQPGNSQQSNGGETYQKELPQLAAPYKRKLETEMVSLNTFAEKLQPALAAAQQKLGFDSQAMNAEFRAITEEPDAARRAQLSAGFQTKYEPQFTKLAQTAGIDLAAQRRQIITLLDLSNKRVKEGKILAIEIGEDEQPTPTLTPLSPDVTESILSAPYTSAGMSGDFSTANASTGDLSLYIDLGFAGSIQNVAFISQTLPVERGVRRVRVSATLDPVRYNLMSLTSPPLGGYSSSEAIVNLRVMDGSLVVCSDRLSLGRSVTAVVGYLTPSGMRPVTLRCEFTRPVPDDATTYALIAEIEGWAGAGGLSAAAVDEIANLQRFHVYLHRR